MILAITVPNKERMTTEPIDIYIVSFWKVSVVKKLEKLKTKIAGMIIATKLPVAIAIGLTS